MSKICFITAIYGNYEASCKKFAKQTVATDFICFTDNPNIIQNGWTIDTTAYHITNPNPQDNGTYVNSLANNKHTFNVAKYYKQSFQLIPRLREYKCVVWLDGTIEIIHTHTAEYLLNRIDITPIVGWAHSVSNGILLNEAKASLFPRYTSTFWNGQHQPVQDVVAQYNAYIADGYDNLYWRFKNRFSNDFGVWITCFVAFNNKNPEVTAFLDMWYLQTLKYTTQDQISFPYVCWKTQIIPYTLPDPEIGAIDTHQRTAMYVKHNHGQ